MSARAIAAAPRSRPGTVALDPVPARRHQLIADNLRPACRVALGEHPAACSLTGVAIGTPCYRRVEPHTWRTVEAAAGTIAELPVAVGPTEFGTVAIDPGDLVRR